MGGATVYQGDHLVCADSGFNIVCGTVQLANACSVISELLGLSVILWTAASILLSFSSSWPSRSSNLGSQQRWPTLKGSSQLKQSPCARRHCISSHKSFQMGAAGVGVVRFKVRMTGGQAGRVNCLCFSNWSSHIRANLMAFFNVWGLNSRMASDISSFRPPIKVPTKAFCIQPHTQYLNHSNSRW